MADYNYNQRDRSRSPRRRSRSPRHRNRSFSPRSRSRSREGYRRSDRRSRSPVGGSGSARGGPRGEGKEQMMANVRENSQQDRRVYVGNLSYDVKWHHLKDFMRQGEQISRLTKCRTEADKLQPEKYSSPTCYYSQMGCQRWAEFEAGLLALSFLFWYFGMVGLTGWTGCPR
jgi:hypothetical protein